MIPVGSRTCSEIARLRGYFKYYHAVQLNPIDANTKDEMTHLASLLQSCIDHRSHTQGKAIHARVFRRGLSGDTFLANRVMDLYTKCNCSDYATRVFDIMPNKNIFSWNAAVSACCKRGDLDTAHRMLIEMPQRNVVSWNTVISAVVKWGFEETGLDLYYLMIGEGFLPTHFTFASVLSACGGMVALEHGRRCHGLVVKVGLDSHSFVENALVGMYAKCGRLSEAVALFDAMAQQNEVSFTAIMNGLVQHGSYAESMKLFVKMHCTGVHVDAVAVSTVLGACAKMGDEGLSSSSEPCRLLGFSFAELVHTLLIKSGFELETHVGNSLIDMYAKHGYMDKAEIVFMMLHAPSVVSWNVLIAGYGQRGDKEKAMKLLQQMEQLTFKPDDGTYVSLLTACVKSGDLEIAHEHFKRIIDPGVSIWNTLISAYCQEKNYQKSLELFKKMQFFTIQPDRTTLAVVLSSCAGMGLLDYGKQIHSVSLRLLLHSDMFVASGLVDMYSKCGCIEAAKCIFNRMSERDVVSWNSMISGLAIQSLSKEAFLIYKDMRANGMHPTEYSYGSVISSCARLASLAQGREIHAQTEKDGYANDVIVGSALIDMYAKCGGVEEARHFFNTMPRKNIVSWNEMIHGYAQNGYGYEAVELFRDMLNTNEKPDEITFVAALTACSHSGLVDEALEIFYSIEKEHALRPLADHYTCIIDALGRASRFEEIEDLIRNMPCKDDPIIWEVLLSACRVHANVRLGKLAAEQLFELDPQNSAPYILLSNIYAALGRWNDVAAVRKLMADRKVVKDRGYSWINYKDRVQAFMVDDDLRVVSNHC